MALEFGDIEDDLQGWLGLSSTFDLLDKAKAEADEFAEVLPDTVEELERSAWAEVWRQVPDRSSPERAMACGFVRGLVRGIEASV
jgi:rhamnogalacturonyl hydrolase YesR